MPSKWPERGRIWSGIFSHSTRRRSRAAFQEVVYDQIMTYPDPGDTNTSSDADWDDWICMDMDNTPGQDVIETETTRGFPIFEKQVRDTCRPLLIHYLLSNQKTRQLQTRTSGFLARPSKTSWRVRRLKLPFSIERRCPLHIAHSAVDFLQRIVEDFIFGKVVQPFQVHAHGVAVPLKCIFLLGDIHGTTMFHLESCVPDDNVDDDDDDDDENSASDDSSDADYTPSLSDMEESSGDDEDIDGGEDGDK
jgi:hypothetical protein